MIELAPIPPGIGVVAPYDLALDRELWSWTPSDVALYITRTAPPESGAESVERVRELGDVERVAAACRDVAVPGPAVTAYLCASCSFVHGVAGERALRRAMERAGAVSALTSSGALLEALAALDVARLAIGTPYDGAVTEHLAAFLGEAGVEVTGSAHLDMTADVWRMTAGSVRALVHAVPLAGAQAIFLSCTNLPTYDLIVPLEQELGLPVLSANLVTIWSALRHLGMPLRARGERLAAC
jgi:maleate isomerase